ncbi:hypothetical protein SDC9_111816 [bioreactor metagenome]|uniref:DUF1540 domain-containing protein n=1 Tax=bioreactor metagenome TaxID=1076179 RepID=A0A645BHS0_9ZZZZ
MVNNNPNNSIKCSVSSCSYHCKDKNYCSLDEIKVGCSDPMVNECADTECASFRKGGRS